MLDILKEICNNKEMASLYTNRNNVDCFIFGQVLCVNELYLAISAVSPDGFFDGIIMKTVQSVFRIEKESQYSKKMAALLKLAGRNCPSLAENCFLDNDNIMGSLLRYAMKTNGVVALELEDSGIDNVIGTIIDVENAICKILQIDPYGFEDGICFCQLDSITQISLMSQDEQRIKNLWKHNAITMEAIE